MPCNEVCRDQDATPHHSQDQEHVPAHPSKSQEDCRIQPDFVHQVLLFRLYERRYPCKKPFADWRRRVFAVGVLRSRRVDDIVVWSQETEEYGNECCQAEGSAQRGPEGIST